MPCSSSGAGPRESQSLLGRLQELVAVCARLRAQLDLLEGSVAPVVDSLAHGAGADQVIDMLMLGAATVAGDITPTIRDYERALRLARRAVVSVLVDEEGLSVTAAAQRLGISRTVVSRLHADHAGDDQGP